MCRRDWGSRDRAAVGSQVKVKAFPTCRPQGGCIRFMYWFPFPLKAGRKSRFPCPATGGSCTKGNVKNLNNSQNGEVDGAVLSTGDLVHIGPGASNLKLTVGQKLTVDDCTARYRFGSPGDRGSRHRPKNASSGLLDRLGQTAAHRLPAPDDPAELEYKAPAARPTNRGLAPHPPAPAVRPAATSPRPAVRPVVTRSLQSTNEN